MVLLFDSKTSFPRVSALVPVMLCSRTHWSSLAFSNKHFFLFLLEWTLTSAWKLAKVHWSRQGLAGLSCKWHVGSRSALCASHSAWISSLAGTGVYKFLSTLAYVIFSDFSVLPQTFCLKYFPFTSAFNFWVSSYIQKHQNTNNRSIASNVDSAIVNML